MLPNHKTKIVCTLGPSSSSEEVIRGLILRGMNVARLNFSHGELEDHKIVINTVRKVSQELNTPVAILVDLPGPKIRIGKLKEPIILQQGETVILSENPTCDNVRYIPIEYAYLTKTLKPGSLIYINDGFLQLECSEISGNDVKCKVLVGGELTSQKGVNFPGSKVFLEPVTPRDLQLIDFGLEQDILCFSISFIESAEDIIKVKKYIEDKNKQAFIVAKIERQNAVENINSILKAADAIMIARGDLGVEIPIEHVPFVQKKIIHKANLLSIPVITATQMLESMIYNVRPTRAEASDVANAIIDGTDAVMLSAETAVGQYPLVTVEMMSRIARNTEKWRSNFKAGIEAMKKALNKMDLEIGDIISLQINEALQKLHIKYVVTPTVSGETPRHISRFRPDTWIIALSRNKKTVTKLAFQYAVYPIYINNDVDDWENIALEKLKEYNLYHKGDKIIITQGQTAGEGRKGGTNLLKFIELQ